MKSIAQIAKELGISHYRIIDYLLKQNIIPNPNANTKIPDDVASSILKNPRILDNKTDFEKLLQNDKYFKRTKEIFYQTKKIKSKFSDQDVKNLCSKMRDNNIRVLAKRFIPELKKDEKTRFELHSIAMRALEEYGPNVISFMLKLKTLPISTRPDKLMTIEKSNINSLNLFLNIDFLSGKEKFRIVFPRYRNNNNLVELWKPDSRFRVFTIGKDGRLNWDYNNVKISLLVYSIKIDEDTKFYSIDQQTQCDICDQLLTDPISIGYGRGPICRQQF